MAKFRNDTKKWPTIAPLSLEEREHLVNRRRYDAALTPVRQARCRALHVEAAGGILDEADAPPALEHPEDRQVVADVRGDAEDDHLLRVEPLEEERRVRVREHVDVLLEQQKLPALQVALGHRVQPERYGIELLG